MHLISYLSASANAERAAPMRAYMKHNFHFLGIKAPDRKALMKVYWQQNALPKTEAELLALVTDLWQQPYREAQYVAMELMEKCKKLWSEDVIHTIEYLITHQSWWDSVDFLATHLVGTYFKRFPQQKNSITLRWIDSDYMWLRRAAIIFQLSYKKQTDTQILSDYIRLTAHEKEFFIAKAIGWALRDYSRHNPAWVLNFVAETDLQPLSRREALRLMK